MAPALRGALLALALAGAALPGGALAQVALRAATSASVANASSAGYAGSGTAYTRSDCGALPLGLPAGTAPGDLLVTVVTAWGSPTLSMPGWNQLALVNPVASHTAALYWRVSTGSDPAALSQAGTCNTLVARVSRFTGIDNTSPFLTSPLVAGNWSYQNAATVTSGTQVASLDGAILLFTAHSSDDDAFGALAGYTQAYSIASTAGNDAAIGLYHATQASAGTFGPYTVTKNRGDDPNVGILFALRPQAGALTLPVPAALVDDVLVASVAVRPCSSFAGWPCTLIVNAPAGWTLVRVLNQTTGGGGYGMRLNVYRRTVTGTEPPAYTWTFGGFPPHVGAAGTMASFAGVDLADPLVAEAGQVTAGSTAHTAPSVNTTPVTNTMLVTTHSANSAARWTPPGGMTEAAEAASLATPNDVGVSLEMNAELRAAAGATGTRTASFTSPSPSADTGAAHMLALRPRPGASLLGGFNAFESSTVAGAITGVITTKIAGAAATVDVVALNTTRTGVLTSFTGNVRVEVLDARDDSGALNTATACRSTWTSVFTLSPNPSFAAADNGRKTITFTVPEAYRNARIRVSYPTGSATTQGCSADNFAIRPASLGNVAASDNDWETPGTARSLANASGSGGFVHKAGRPFRLAATARNALGNVTANYDGSPTVRALGFTLPALGACPSCVLNPGAWSGTGTVVSTTASYTEAGAVGLTLEDVTFAGVDENDSTLDQRTIPQATAVPVGRFVPDRFELVATNTPRLRTFNAADAACSCPDPPACLAERRTFTYIGQPFGWVTAPVARIVAKNATGASTLNYAGTLWKLTSADATLAYSPAATILDVSAAGTPSVTSSNDGSGLVTSAASGTLRFVRDNASPQAAFDAAITLAVSVQDPSENAPGQGVIGTTVQAVFDGDGSGIDFDGGGASSGRQFRYGRLWLSAAYGAEGIDLEVPLEAQFWNGFGFVRNVADHCSRLVNGNVVLSGHSPAAFAASLPQASVTFAGAFQSGRAGLKLARPGARGSARLCVDLDSGPGGDTACQATVPAAQPWLQARRAPSVLHDRDPAGIVSFGVYKGPQSVIYQRENY